MSTEDQLPDADEVIACLACERNQRQSDLIRRLWAENRSLKRRCQTQQGMIDWLRKKMAQPATPSKFEAAEALFK